jgi:hypothetical protein
MNTPIADEIELIGFADQRGDPRLSDPERSKGMNG